MVALTLLASSVPVQTMQAGTEKAVKLSLNGEPVQLSTLPRLAQNTLMVPLRELSEALGVTVQWNESERTAEASKGNRTIKLTLDSKQAYRGSTAIPLDEAPTADHGYMLVPLRFFSESFDFNVYWDGANRSVDIVDADKSLPTVGSLERMEELLKDFTSVNGGMRFTTTDQAVATGAAKESVSASPSAPGSSSVSAPPSHSGTNVQVEGVDEADIIKTDGKYIYQVNRDRVIVSQAYPAESMSVISTVYWADPYFYPQEIYVDDKHLVVIGNTHYPVYDKPQVYDSGKPATSNPSNPVSSPALEVPVADNIRVIPVPEPSVERKLMIWPRPERSTVKTIVYELGDRTNMLPVRETELEGNYISSRKIGDSLYIVTNKWLNTYGFMNRQISPAEKQQAVSTPAYRDSAAGEAFISIGYEDIRYFPKAVEPNYLLVGGMSLSKPEQKMQVTSYLGSGQHVYASQNNLYITVNEYEPAAAEPEPAPAPAPKASPEAEPRMMPSLPMPTEMSSVIYKFGMDDGTVHYTGRGKVPGHPLNQFSMDEHEGYFRIATTKGDMWRDDEFTSKNNMYILNDTMNIVGKVEDLAPGERIYSVRYAGNRAYMVTFKNVDPLFVIDLRDPQAPEVLGQLKIPGYSDYLHPYDENHIIGFGKDAVEVDNKNGTGLEEGPTAYYQGMKLALFDVSDVTQPKELFKESIGDRGTHSELLHNHKALLFSKEKNLLAFPVTVMEVKDKSSSGTPNDATQYGEFAFQGAYVYGLDLQQGFQLRGKITHLSADDLQKAGQHWFSSDRNIERLLYIGDTLYTASPDILKANDLSTLTEIGSLNLPPWSPRQ
nr:MULTISPECIES: beta-propeller domain-containing protein [unclassified Paenibacillus]